jgi:hypothetical protein
MTERWAYDTDYEKYGLQCAVDIMARLNYDADAIRRFRAVLLQALAAWNLRAQNQSPGPQPKRSLAKGATPFRVIEGGAR